ncbi:MAG: ATP-binding protein [Thermoprotei archaeon]|nr:MAG: ATP-binding protein [Thermoprotei archaeon]
MEELISRHNPWWSDREDITVSRWRSLRVRWIPKWIERISLKPFSLNFVVGPRQIGKTTGIKLLINDLVKNVEKESVFYFNCDFLPDISSLKKVLDSYISFKKSMGIDNSFIFLDEVTSVPEWWRIIKGYIDLGIFKNDVLTITGSSSLRLKGEVELFPGRRGGGKDIFVYPLTFREYLEVHGLKVELEEDVEKTMRRLLKDYERIKELFRRYLKTGGFPLAINQDPTAEEQFIAGMESDILKAKYNLQLTKEVIGSIMRKAPSPCSFSTIGRDIGVSYKTVQEYINMLRNIFILDIAMFKKDRVKWRKEKKFFFLDPFIAHTLSLWSGEKYLESALYEWIVQSHLSRRFGEVFYFRNSFEIDCIADDLKVEVKIGKPHRRYPKNVFVIDSENIHLFLASIV